MDTIWIIVIAVVAAVILLSIMLAIANNSGDRFMEMYDKMMHITANSHKSVMEFINEQNFAFFGGKLKVARTDKKVGDAYSAKYKTLVLTDQTLNADSIGSFSIIAHELGHAQQDFTSGRVKRMNVLHKIGSIVGKLFVPALLAAVVLLFIENLRVYAYVCAGVAGAIFLFAVLVKFLTVRLEKDASKRAIVMLDEFMPANEMKDVKKFLKSARMTYWSDLMRLLFGWTGLVKKTKMF